MRYRKERRNGDLHRDFWKVCVRVHFRVCMCTGEGEVCMCGNQKSTSDSSSIILNFLFNLANVIHINTVSWPCSTHIPPSPPVSPMFPPPPSSISIVFGCLLKKICVDCYIVRLSVCATLEITIKWGIVLIILSIQLHNVSAFVACHRQTINYRISEFYSAVARADSGRKTTLPSTWPLKGAIAERQELRQQIAFIYLCCCHPLSDLG